MNLGVNREINSMIFLKHIILDIYNVPVLIVGALFWHFSDALKVSDVVQPEWLTVLTLITVGIATVVKHIITALKQYEELKDKRLDIEFKEEELIQKRLETFRIEQEQKANTAPSGEPLNNNE